MSRLIAALLALPLILTGAAQAEEPLVLDSLEKRYSYAVGTKIAEQLKSQMLQDDSIDREAFVRGLQDILSDKAPQLTVDEADGAIAEMRTAALAAAEAENAKALEEGQAFLADHGKTEGITTTESGLQYAVTTEGTGEKPQADSTVTVHYEGRLLDGTVFDSSYARGEPATFPVGGVIKGWQEVLPMMPAGSKWEVWIPSELAYGAQGAGGQIGPNQVLNFTIELISIAE